MWIYLRMLQICYLIFSLSVGCATTQYADVLAKSSPATQPATMEKSADSLPLPGGWPPYYKPLLLEDIYGKYIPSGEKASVKRAYLLHRTDFEKVRILYAREKTCAIDLTSCEKRISDLNGTPSFWNRWEGRMLLIGLGIVAGTGATIGMVYAVGK